MIEGGDGVARKKKLSVCVDAQPRALRRTVFLSTLPRSFRPLLPTPAMRVSRSCKHSNIVYNFHAISMWGIEIIFE